MNELLELVMHQQSELAESQAALAKSRAEMSRIAIAAVHHQDKLIDRMKTQLPAHLVGEPSHDEQATPAQPPDTGTPQMSELDRIVEKRRAELARSQLVLEQTKLGLDGGGPQTPLALLVATRPQHVPAGLGQGEAATGDAWALSALARLKSNDQQKQVQQTQLRGQELARVVAEQRAELARSRAHLEQAESKIAVAVAAKTREQGLKEQELATTVAQQQAELA